MWRFLKKLKIELPYNPAILLLGTCPKELNAGSQRDTCSPLFIAATLTQSNMETGRTDRQMDKQGVVYTYNRISLSFRTHSDMYYNLRGP